MTGEADGMNLGVHHHHNNYLFELIPETFDLIFAFLRVTFSIITLTHFKEFLFYKPSVRLYVVWNFLYQSSIRDFEYSIRYKKWSTYSPPEMWLMQHATQFSLSRD